MSQLGYLSFNPNRPQAQTITLTPQPDQARVNRDLLPSQSAPDRGTIGNPNPNHNPKPNLKPWRCQRLVF
jgi:hypothetical protein